MEFLDSIKQTYKRSLDFTGRTGRSEFWWFKLYFWGGLFIWSIIDYLLFGFIFWDPYSDFGWLGAIWIISNLLPYFSINNRRLMDTGKGNWKIKPSWLLPITFIILQILLVLFIIIGWIILWVWWSEESYESDPEKRPIGIPQ